MCVLCKLTALHTSIYVFQAFNPSISAIALFLMTLVPQKADMEVADTRVATVAAKR